MAALPLRWPGHGGRRRGRGKTGAPRMEPGGFAGGTGGRREGFRGAQGLVEADPCREPAGIRAGLQGEPLPGHRSSGAVCRLQRLTGESWQASGQDAGSSGRQWTWALGPFWSQCDSGMGYHPSEGRRSAQGGAAIGSPRKKSPDRCNLPIPTAEIFPPWLELSPHEPQLAPASPWSPSSSLSPFPFAFIVTAATVSTITIISTVFIVTAVTFFITIPPSAASLG